jgi:hypothetical protein
MFNFLSESAPAKRYLQLLLYQHGISCSPVSRRMMEIMAGLQPSQTDHLEDAELEIPWRLDNMGCPGSIWCSFGRP